MIHRCCLPHALTRRPRARTDVPNAIRQPPEPPGFIEAYIAAGFESRPNNVTYDTTDLILEKFVRNPVGEANAVVVLDELQHCLKIVPRPSVCHRAEGTYCQYYRNNDCRQQDAFPHLPPSSVFRFLRLRLLAGLDAFTSFLESVKSPLVLL